MTTGIRRPTGPDALSRLPIPPPARTAGPARPAEFGVLDLDVPEHRQPGEPAEDYVRRVAREKAGAGLLKVMGNPAAVVLGSDTEVVLDDEVFGKPRDADDAAAMLRELSGRTHQVISAVSLVSPAREAQTVSVSEVELRRAERSADRRLRRRRRMAGQGRRLRDPGLRRSLHRPPVGQLLRRDGPAGARDRDAAAAIRPGADAARPARRCRHDRRDPGQRHPARNPRGRGRERHAAGTAHRARLAPRRGRQHLQGHACSG